MNYPPRTLLAGTALALVACSTPDGTGPGPTATYRAAHVATLIVGANDNAEVIKLIPGRSRALLVSSKARKITLLDVQANAISQVRSHTLFSADPSESELTHVAVSNDGTWAVITRTKIDKDSSETVVDCRGELVFISIEDDQSFGSILSQVEVGPMPDSVAISPNGAYVASANERDVVWGKCADVDQLAPPSISLLDISQGPAQASEVKRIRMMQPEREPESVHFTRDGNGVVVTLQDSHELAFIDIQAVLTITSPEDKDATIVPLPANNIGQDAWPDGVLAFTAGDGREYFAIAGEANDSLIISDSTGAIVANQLVEDNRIPATFPRDGSWGPLFQPDSLAAFQHQGVAHLAMTLKGAGAVAIWNLADVQQPTLLQAVKVGMTDQGDPNNVSTIGSEGIAADPGGTFILVANEQESSVSLLRPEP